MDFKQLFDDDRAVSPVIGVILMVAITVILAAVIGTFVLGLGDQVQNTTPRASFGFDTTNGTDNVVITHESGDTIQGADLSVKATSQFNATDSDGAPTETSSANWSSLANGESEVSAGSSVNITRVDAASNSFAGDTVRIVYSNPNSDSSSTLGKYEVPN